MGRLCYGLLLNYRPSLQSAQFNPSASLRNMKNKVLPSTLALSTALAASQADATIYHFTTTLTANAIVGDAPWDIDGGAPMGDVGMEVNVDYNAGSYINLRIASGGFGVVAYGGRLLNMSSGDTVDSVQGFHMGTLSSIFASGDIWNAVGFTSGVPGYIGFTFDYSGTQVYGWAAVTLTEVTSSGQFQITEWAFQDSGAAILVGSTVPEPASYAAGLGALALGAAGLRRWRKAKVAA